MESKSYFIVRRGHEYLVAIAYPCSLLPRYSTSPWDAAPIKRIDDARMVAKQIGGHVRRFNPVTGVVA